MTRHTAASLDLVVLAPGKDDAAALDGLLRRSEDMGIRPTSYEILVHPRHDSGCLRFAHDFLRPLLSTHRHALVVFDRLGSGGEARTAEELEGEVAGLLAVNGWDTRGAAVVIEPELENWVWADSPVVARGLGWGGRLPPLREWLSDRGLWGAGAKPEDPKAAMDAVLREVTMRRTSAIYGLIASRVDFAGCSDASFQRFRSTITSWFGQ